jgi:hypothetical protein
VNTEIELTRLRHDIDRLNELVRDKFAQVETQLNTVTTKTNIVESEIKRSDNFGVTNLLLNSDASFSTQSYQGILNANTLAHWYRIDVSSNTQITENGASVSPQAITTTSAPSSWDKPAGVVLWKGTDAIQLPIQKNIFSPGTEFYVSFFVKGNNLSPTESNPINPLPADLRLFVSIRVNTAPTDYLKGQAISGTGVSINGPAGGHSRNYIIVAQFPGEEKASSAQFGTGAILGFDTTPSATNWVDVFWNRVLGAVNILLYRSADGGPWKLIAILPGNFTTFRDAGDSITTTTSAPATSQVPLARSVSQPLKDGLTSDFNLLSFRLRVPYNITFPTVRTFLRLEPSASLGSNGLTIDKILLATSVGRWTPAGQDLNVSGAVDVTNPPPFFTPIIINPGPGGGNLSDREFL